jgi:organic hydroperoxide reductase OsmC/OhrA
MSEHRIALEWRGGDAAFTYEAYPRNHVIRFKNGEEMLVASASPAYRGDGSKADPEDLLVGALSSCHMLSFLAIAAKKRITVTSYQDDATGYLENAAADGKTGPLWMARVVLRPQIVSDADDATIAEIHHRAHEACFIANSVRTEVSIEPR